MGEYDEKSFISRRQPGGVVASANVKAAELVVSTDTPLSENVTFGTGQTYDSFSNKDNALYGFDASDTENHNITLVQEPPASI